MRRLYILAILVIFFTGFVVSVVNMERLRANGTDLMLPLAAVDPRALLMGDYMALDYAVNSAIRSALIKKSGKTRLRYDDASNLAESGLAVVRLRPTLKKRPDLPPKIAFVRLDDGTPLGRDEFPLRYKARGRRVITAAPSFYFQEGEAAIYAKARYAKVKVDENGTTLLVALCDARGMDLKPDKQGGREPGGPDGR